MLRSALIILLLLAFTGDMFRMAWVQLDYRLNTARFAANCENKARPAMKCHGKCQMRKQIRNEEQKDQRSATGKSNQKNEITCQHLPGNAACVPGVAQLIVFPVDNPWSLPYNEGKGIFHPPALV